MAEHDEPQDPPRRNANDAVQALMAAVAHDIAAVVAPLRDEIDALKAQHALESATFTERLTQQDGWIAELASRVRELERGTPTGRE